MLKKNMEEKNKKAKIFNIRGMNDILPDESPIWEVFENTIFSVLNCYGYKRIRTPIIEHTKLFKRSLGEITDIVEKEMYTFVDRLNGDDLTLRPESTAGIVRSVIQHNLAYEGPKRLFYYGPMFRHERPQRGRFRQFYQVGAEAVGFLGPDIDVELILLCRRLWEDLGLNDIKLELNTIGDLKERNQYKNCLIDFFKKYFNDLDDDSKKRLESNPLRILDSKNAKMSEIIREAPSMNDFLGSDSIDHFEKLKNLLNENNVNYKINTKLVRGLDYYNRTVFEWISHQSGSDITICGGGRYDTLFEICGGMSTPAVGFALGVERLIELIKTTENNFFVNNCDVYISHNGENALNKAFNIGERLRDMGLVVEIFCGSYKSTGSFKTQIRQADISGALCALIIGEDEIKNNYATIKYLRENNFQEKQIKVPFDKIFDHMIDFFALENE